MSNCFPLNYVLVDNYDKIFDGMFLKLNFLCNSTNISKCIMIKGYGARSCNVLLPYFNEFFVFMYIVKLLIHFKVATYLKYDKFHT